MTATTEAATQQDPEGSKFYTHPARLPGDGWAYIADDFGVAYRRDTLWPFRSDDPVRERESVASLVRRGKEGFDWSLGEGCGYWAVRIAPDAEYCNAGQNYVTLWPDLHEAHKAHADLHLYVRGQGLVAIVLDCTLLIDLRDMTGVITTWPIGGSPIGADGFSEDFPEALKAQGAEKRAKVLAFLAAEMTRRDAGEHGPVTAYDRRFAS